jgi:DNA-binding Lrp family transcriptional regulator
MRKPQAPEVVLKALEKAGPAGTTARRLADQTGIPPRTVRHALSTLERLRRIERVGSRNVRLRGFADQPPIPLPTPGGLRLWKALRDGDQPAYITGLDVLAPYAQHFVQTFPHIVIADRGTGPEVSYALAEAGFTVQQPGAAALAPNADALVIVRELATRQRYGAADHVAPAELAWLDLFREARAGYPIAPTELGRVLQTVLSQGAARSRLTTIARDHFATELRAVLEDRSDTAFGARVAAGLRA